MIKLVPDEEDERGAELMDLICPLKAWAQYYYKNGTIDSDPRKKQIESMQKKTFEEFYERFLEMIEMPGAPYASAFAKQDGTVVLRKKPNERVWDSKKTPTTGPLDDFIDNVDEIRGPSITKAASSRLKLSFKRPRSAAKTTIGSWIVWTPCTCTFWMKLVWNKDNRAATLMTTPKLVVVGSLGAPRSAGSAVAERAVDIFSAVNAPASAKEDNDDERVAGKRKSSSVDIMDVLKTTGKTKKSRK